MKDPNVYSHRLISIMLLVGLWLALGPSASAQTAELTGRITDSSGAVIQGAKLALTKVDTSISKNAVSNQEGIYAIPFLPPGQYRVTVEKAGFRTLRQEGITLSVEQVARLDFVLTAGELVQQVTVQSTAPLLESETSSVDQVIENKTIITLPLNGRIYSQLTLLMPGAAPTTGTRHVDGLNLNGNRIFQNTFLIDGLENNKHTLGAVEFTQLVYPSVDAIQEFKVESANYSAEYGRSAGGIISVAIKSGTNAFHGSAFEFLRNDKLDANDFFANRAGLKRSPLRFNQFGGTLGGPVLHNRTFFFASFQGTRDHRSNTVTTTVPTPEMVRGNFGRVNIYDPHNVVNGVRQSFPNNIIPENRMDPVGRRLAALYPAPNQPGSVNNYVANQSLRDTSDQVDARVDHTFRASDSLFIRYSRADRESGQGSLFLPPGNGGAVTTQLPGGFTPKADSLAGGETHIFSVFLANELRFGSIKYESFRGVLAPRPLFDEFGFKGIPPLDGLIGLPQVTIQTFSALGDGTGRPVSSGSELMQMSDNLSWNRGNHTWKFGADIRLERVFADFAGPARGAFTFNGQFTSRVPGQGTGSSVADLLLGQTSSAQLTTRQTPDFRDHYYGFYGQDNWKVSPTLTLNLGLRYELQTPTWDADNRIANFDLKRGSPTYGTIVLAKEGSILDRSFRHFDRNNFAPRLGLAYQIDAKTVIRGSLGLFYGGLGFQTLASSLATNIPYFVSITFPSPSTASVSNLVLADGFPANALDPRNAVNPDAYAVLEDSPLAEIYQWNLGLQREFFGSTVFSISYVGSGSSHLRGFSDINAPIPGPGLVNPRRLFPAFGGINVSSDFVHATYHSLQTKLERRFNRGLSLLASYTWSHAIDNSQDPEEQTIGPPRPQNPKDTNAEKADAGFDLRHRLVTSVIYDPPLGRAGGFLGGSRVMRGALGGFQLAGIFVAQTGPTINPSVNGNPTNTADTTSIRPNRLSDGNLPGGERSVDRWFDPTAFAIQAPFTFGNSGRNVLRGPGLVNLDLLVARNFRFTESKRLELRGEFFNFTNTAHFGKPNATIGSPQAGRITSTATPNRQVQIGLRFVF